ncbi:NAD-dependent epimerase/dehydratase family protein [Paraburkholderia phosphatilytica]|uniref:NAD-dependent epimerase/dehydratase family protein n=1 Tax=Paraburkholderia phosphatilytica TaxID=2282883 RepID=UPI000E4BDB6B|nr:NAD-dependent epimerase/dehydratase family protein [Paraburkholderia phosphatilytica]
MKVLIYGATGMVGQGVLRECLAAPDVELVQIMGRRATGISDPKLREVIQTDPGDSRSIEARLGGFDACFFCLGVSSVGVKEAAYTRITYDLTIRIAEPLARLNPQMTFVYVSGASTDSTERGRSMWARVKGRTENTLRTMPFRAVYLFRPGPIQPLGGIRSKTALYQLFIVLARPLWPLMRLVAPDRIVTTAEVGQAMLAVARHGAPVAFVEAPDILALARGQARGEAGATPAASRSD